MQRKGKTFIVSGPSGVGKSTVLKALFDQRTDLYFSISATTRDPRPGEVDGVHYHFIPAEEFHRMVEEDEFLEYAEYVGNFYGTPKKYVDRAMDDGRDVILDIEIQGANQICAKRPETYYDNPMVLNNYAYFISESSRDPRQLDRAFAMAARAVELDGNNATLLDTYAWVLFRLGRLQEARRTMQQAISFDRSENPELYLHYGDILAALGEKFMAETYWRKALEKGYDDPRAIEERIRQLKSKP